MNPRREAETVSTVFRHVQKKTDGSRRQQQKREKRKNKRIGGFSSHSEQSSWIKRLPNAIKISRLDLGFLMLGFESSDKSSHRWDEEFCRVQSITDTSIIPTKHILKF